MKNVKKAFISFLIIAIGVIVLLPLLWVVICSFKPEGDIVSYPPRWIPKAVTLVNYTNVLTQFHFVQWMINSIIVSVVSTVLVMILDSLAGYALGRFRFRGRNVIFFLVMAMLLIPMQAYVVPLFILFKYMHLLFTYQALVLPLLGQVTGVYLLKQFFEGLPNELEEAARIDGCNEFTIYLRIMLPLSKPIMSSVAILMFVSSWNNFLWPLIATRSDATKTLPVGLAQFMSASGGVSGSAPQYGISLAAACMAILPTVIIFLCLQKYFVEGVVSSGIKG